MTTSEQHLDDLGFAVFATAVGSIPMHPPCGLLVGLREVHLETCPAIDRKRTDGRLVDPEQGRFAQVSLLTSENRGDHAADVVRAIDVGLSTSIEDLIRLAGLTYSSDLIAIRVADPPPTDLWP